MGVQQHLDFVGRWKLADASLVTAGPGTTGRDNGPVSLASREQEILELPMEARRDAFIDAVWDWAGEGGRVYFIAKSAESIEWEQWLPAGTRLEQLDGIVLPVGQTPGRDESGGRRRLDALPGPGPNSIFDLTLDGQPLLLFELKR
jgi:hypothetical protein